MKDFKYVLGQPCVMCFKENNVGLKGSETGVAAIFRILCKSEICELLVCVHPFQYFVSQYRKFGFWPYERLLYILRPQKCQMPVV